MSELGNPQNDCFPFDVLKSADENHWCHSVTLGLRQSMRHRNPQSGTSSAEFQLGAFRWPSFKRVMPSFRGHPLEFGAHKDNGNQGLSAFQPFRCGTPAKAIARTTALWAPSHRRQGAVHLCLALWRGLRASAQTPGFWPQKCRLPAPEDNKNLGNSWYLYPWRHPWGRGQRNSFLHMWPSTKIRERESALSLRR